MMDLKKKVVKATAWANLALFAEHGITFFFTILLVRILFPEDFGLITLANLVVLFVIMLKNFGMNQALIQRKTDVEKAADITFILQLAASIAFFVLVFFSSPLIAKFFSNSLLEPIIKVLSFTIIIEAFGVTHSTLLEKGLDFKKKFLPISLGTLVYNFLAVFLAFAGFGVWSLVIGQITKMLVSTILFWFVCPWRPSFSFDSRIAKEMVGYGKYAVCRDFVGFFSQRVDSLFVGKFLGSVSLGFYNRSYDLSQALFQRLSLTAAMFPAFSKLQYQKKRMLEMFFKMTKYASVVLLPLLFGLFVVSSNFVRVMFGQKWAPMLPLLRVLLIYGVLNVFTVMVGALFKAIGRVKLLLNLEIAELVILVITLFFAWDYGVLGVCVAVTVVSLIMNMIGVVLVVKASDVGVFDYLKLFSTSFLGSAVMMICVFIAQNVVSPWIGFGSISNLVFSVFIGVFVYFWVLFFLDRKLLGSVKRIFGLLCYK